MARVPSSTVSWLSNSLWFIQYDPSGFEVHSGSKWIWSGIFVCRANLERGSGQMASVLLLPFKIFFPWSYVTVKHSCAVFFYFAFKRWNLSLAVLNILLNGLFDQFRCLDSWVDTSKWCNKMPTGNNYYRVYYLKNWMCYTGASQ